MVLIGEGVAAVERSIQAKPEAKAEDNVVLHGRKIGAWTAAPRVNKNKEESEHWDVSSGYGSNVSSLDEEENLKDTASESGGVVLTSSPMCGMNLSAGRITMYNPWTPEFGPRTSSPMCGGAYQREG